MGAAACLLWLACASAPSPASAPPPPAFESQRAFEHLQTLVAIGPRPAGSPGAARARAYIVSELRAAGLAPAEQAFEADTPAGRLRMVNVRAVVPGRVERRLIIASHYDTKRFEDFEFVGANDGGSSTALLIELARVLTRRDNALSIELVFFDGEESVGEWETGNTWGSRHYVDAARRDGTLERVKAMVLVDMIGDRDLVIKRESHSTPWLTDIIWSAARRLNRPEFVTASTSIEDDHLPFLAAGIPAVNIIDLDYPAWHTEADTLDQVSARSLQVVADVLLEALPAIELRLR